MHLTVRPTAIPLYCRLPNSHRLGDRGQRNQIMGHRNAAVFRRHYPIQQSRWIQSAYLRTPGNRTAGRYETSIPYQDLQSPELAELLVVKENLGSKLKEDYRTIIKSKRIRPDLYKEYARLTNKIAAVRSASKEEVEEWHENADHHSKSVASFLQLSLIAQYVRLLRDITEACLVPKNGRMPSPISVSNKPCKTSGPQQNTPKGQVDGQPMPLF